MLEGAERRVPKITEDGDTTERLIQGVVLKDVKNVISPNAVITEVHRQDWGIGSEDVAQINVFSFHPNAISAWDCHQMQQDRVMCIKGTLRLALYDDRADSPTRGTVNVLHLSDMRPQLVFIPPNIWHGFQNLLNEVSTALVHVDRLYRHEDPDSWKLPHDSSQIPYQFQPR